MSKIDDMPWDQDQLLLLKAFYPRTKTNALAKIIGKTCNAVQTKAARMKIKKWVEAVPAGYKRCPDCHEVKPVTDYWLSQNVCKVCMMKRRTEWGNKNRKHLAQYRFLRCARNPERMQEQNIRGTHKYRSINKDGHDLTNAEWKNILKQYNGICPACGEKFTEENPAERDCIVPVSKGGLLTKSNVQPLHHGCNVRKGNNTIRYLIGKY